MAMQGLHLQTSRLLTAATLHSLWSEVYSLYRHSICSRFKKIEGAYTDSVCSLTAVGTQWRREQNCRPVGDPLCRPLLYRIWCGPCPAVGLLNNRTWV